MSPDCNQCYLNTTQPEWVARLVIALRQDKPCDKHATPWGHTPSFYASCPGGHGPAPDGKCAACGWRHPAVAPLTP